MGMTSKTLKECMERPPQAVIKLDELSHLELGDTANYISERD
jgi:hypothetical protein